MKGIYIVFEGVVGTGKSTQSKKLLEYLKKKYPEREVILTREPGGSEIAESIRKIVQATKFEEKMDPICEAYLYASARAQTLRSVVKPVIEKGGIAIADRSFLSSVAYQGYARNLGYKLVMDINLIAVSDLMPDMILYMDLSPELGLKRSFDKYGDKFESEDVEFFKKVEFGYKQISRMPEFRKKWVNIDASGNIEEVFKRIIEAMDTLHHPWK